MKIVQFLHGKNYGGMEGFCINLSNELAKKHKMLFIGEEIFRRYLSDDVMFVPFDSSTSRNNLLSLWRIYNILKSFSPDVVHVHKQKSIEVMKRLYFLLNIPFVATKHDTQKKKAFYGLDFAISISDETTKTIQAKKIFKIYNGIPYVEPRKIKMPDAFNIVAVGGLREVKGYNILISAVSKLPFNVHLTIIGEGSVRPLLESLIAQYSLEGKVSLVGFKENVQDYLYSSDLQVISSLSEGFSLSMIEGIFYAPMLISTRVSGCTEILPGELLYDIADLSNKMVDISKSYDKYSTIFKKIKKNYTDQLTINICAQEHERVYAQILKDPCAKIF